MTEPGIPGYEADSLLDDAAMPQPDVCAPKTGRPSAPPTATETHGDADLDAPVPPGPDLPSGDIGPKWIVEATKWHPFLALFAAYAYLRRRHPRREDGPRRRAVHVLLRDHESL